MSRFPLHMQTMATFKLRANCKLNSLRKDSYHYMVSCQPALVTGTRNCYAFVWVTFHRRLICTDQCLRLRAWKQASLQQPDCMADKHIKKLIYGRAVGIQHYATLQNNRDHTDCNYQGTTPGIHGMPLASLPRYVHASFHHANFSIT